MTLRRYIRFSRHEQIGLVIAGIFFVAGLGVSFVCNDAAMLGRFGACIIIVGVIFAVTDLPKKLEGKAKKMVDLRLALSSQSAVDALEELDQRNLSEEEKKRVSSIIDRQNREHYERQANLPTKRFLLVEVFIVCFGTFINGWGEWILQYFFVTFQ